MHGPAHKANNRLPLPSAGTLPLWEWVLIFFLVGSLGLAISWLAGERSLLINSDFFSFARRIERLGKAPWQQTWVDGLYPIGYPYLLKWLAGPACNYLGTARAISAASAWVVLGCTYAAARRLGSVWLASAVVLLLGGNIHFLTFSSAEGTDLPALAFVMAGLTLATAPRQNLWKAALAGALLGMAYMVRYTALIALPVLLFGWLATLARPTKQTLKLWLAACLAFALLTAPQWIASWYITGTPLYNTQHWNVWYALEGRGAWWRIPTEAVRYPGLGAILADLGFARFGKNLVSNLYRLVVYNQFEYTLYPLWSLGALLALLQNPKKTWLWVGWIALFGAAVSITFLSPRILLPLMPVIILLSLYPLQWLEHKGFGWMGTFTWPAVFGLGGFLALFNVLFAHEYMHSTYEAAQRGLYKAFRQHGMANVGQVASFSYNLYNPNSAQATRYDVPWLGDPTPISSEAEVLWLIAKGRYQFAAFDWQVAADMPGFSTWWAHRQFAPPMVKVFQSPEAEGYYLPDSVLGTFRPATAQDWAAFSAQYAPAMAQSWGSLRNLLQEDQRPSYKTTGQVPAKVQSAWRRYKGLHRLL